MSSAVQVYQKCLLCGSMYLITKGVSSFPHRVAVRLLSLRFLQLSKVLRVLVHRGSFPLFADYHGRLCNKDSPLANVGCLISKLKRAVALFLKKTGINEESASTNNR